MMRAVGEMPEWPNGTDSKSVVLATVPRVQIPISPPLQIKPQKLCFWGFLFFCVRKIWTQDSTRRGQGCQGMMMDVEKLSRHLQDSMPDLQAIYLFGSYVSGDFQSHSDLDMAVLLKTRCNPVALWQLSGELADIAGVPVDLVDLRAASTIMQYQVLITGRRIWVADSSVGLFEAFVLSEKTDLDAARAGLLEDVQKEGVIHGR